MGSGEEEVVEIDSLERGLLPDADADDPVLYTASFLEKEDNFVKYQTAQWVLYSLLLILAWGIGFFMLFYLPVRRYILRRDIRSRKLYLTPNAIVYQVIKHSLIQFRYGGCYWIIVSVHAFSFGFQVARPVPFPCFGVLKKEKHVLLPSVRDIVIEQGTCLLVHVLGSSFTMMHFFSVEVEYCCKKIIVIGVILTLHWNNIWLAELGNSFSLGEFIF